jgi:hypothetical protein
MKDLLFKALSAHVCCKNILYQAIETGICEPPSSAIRDDRICEFGKWLHNLDLSAQLKAFTYYENTRKAHTDFHIAASKVMMLVETGETDKAMQLLVNGEYSVASNNLKSEIIKWRASLID